MWIRTTNGSERRSLRGKERQRNSPVDCFDISPKVRSTCDKIHPLPPRRQKLYIACGDFFYIIFKNRHGTHAAAPPFRKKSRLVRLFACKRAHDGFGSLPTFCGDAGQLHLFRSTLPVRVSIWTLGFLFLQFRYEHRYHVAANP